jgi:hypothetical protein
MRAKLLLLLVVLIVLLVGCVNAPANPSPSPELQKTTVPIPPSITLETVTTSVSTIVPVVTPTTQPITPILTPTPSPSPSFSPAPTPTGPYTGPLFDDHLHLYDMYQGSPQQLSLMKVRTAGDLISYLDRNKIVGAIGFYAFTSNKLRYPWGSTFETIISGAKSRVVPMVQPTPWSDFASGQFSETVLQQYLQPQGLCQGVGELVLKKPELQSITLDGSVMQIVFKAVDEKKGIVMIHPSSTYEGGRSMELSEIESAVSQYPDIIFIFHPGLLAYKIIEPLLSKYSNVYYSIDFAGATTTTANLLFPVDASFSNKEAFLSEVNRIGIDNIVNEIYRVYATVIGKYPERFFWGTDFGGDTTQHWHFEDSVTDMVIKISREFIGKLPADIQEKYAYKNAQRVFGRFLSP